MSEPSSPSLEELILGLGLELPEPRLRKLRELVDLVEEWNARFNLTAIRDRRGIEIRHVLDSLVPAAHGWRDVAPSIPGSVVDVGSGAGFPALPLAIAFPEVRVTAIESVRKKADFIALAAARLGVDVRVIRERAESAGHSPVLRERFDLAIARAVAYLPTLAEYCLPFVRVGGRFVAMKGDPFDEELEHGLHAVERLGGRVREPVRYSLPEVSGGRALLVFEKVSGTPDDYPRRPGLPARRPIIGQ